MAFITDRSVFIHVQKTGGMYVREALGLCRPMGRESGPPEADRHVGLPELLSSNPGIAAGKFVFGFVRHPVAWLESRWSYGRLSGFATQARHRGKAAAHWMASCWSEDYTRFVELQLERFPGVATQTMFRMLGLWSERPADFVGRCEQVVLDTYHALEAAGETFDKDKLVALPRRNRSVEKPETPRALRSRIEQSERALMERFYG